MEKNKSAKNSKSVNGGLYIALAICILSVICIGVYSAIINIFKTDEISSPIINEPNNVINEKKPAENTTNKEVSVNKDNSEKEVSKNEDVGEQVNSVPETLSFTKPVAGAVNKEFSIDVLVYSETMNDYRTHRGVDFAANVGDPVKCFAKGVVSDIYEDPLMGQTVVVTHSDNLKSVYSNLSPELPKEIIKGYEVKEGEVIGGVGETCLIECAETSHLHFEVIADGNNVDPMQYFK